MNANLYDYLWKSYQSFTHSKVIPFIQGSKKVLDVGCGTGTLLSKLGPDVHKVGLDPSKKMVERADKKVNGEILLGNAEQLPSDSYDAIISSSALHRYQDVEMFLEQARSRLNKNGKVVILDWDAVFPYTILYRLYKLLDRDIQGLKNADQVANITRIKGFGVESYHVYHWWTWRFFLLVLKPTLNS